MFTAKEGEKRQTTGAATRLQDRKPASTQSAQSSASVSRPAPTKAVAPSIISSDMKVVGTITATGDMQIDGTVEGDIKSSSLTVGENAHITGELRAEEVIVRGTLAGSIRSHKVILGTTARVEGDILHQSLAVETGAFFQGNCRHCDDPFGDGTPTKRTGNVNAGAQ